MLGYNDLNDEHKAILSGYDNAIVDIENILTNGCLGESLIGHYLSYEGNEKAAEELKEEIGTFLAAYRQDLINALADMEEEEKG